MLAAVENQCLLYYKEFEYLNELVEQLRDANLDLEVENFGHVQDVAMLETRSLKYQSVTKMNEQCICEMQNELVQQQAENTHLKQHLCSLTCELTTMQRVINEAKQLHQKFLVLQEDHEQQQRQTDAIRQELIRESKISEIDSTRIEELQEMLKEKTMQLSQYEQQCCCAQKKLEMTMNENKELKNEITELIDHIKTYEESCIENEERTDYCQQEVESCKRNLTELKDKLLMMSGLLRQKNEQYNQLETSYQMQTCTLKCMEQQIAGKELQFEEDLQHLKRTIQDLSDKLLKTESNYHNLLSEYKNSQSQVCELTRIKAKLQIEYTRCQKEFEQQLQAAQKELMCMSTCIKKLKDDQCCVSCEKKALQEQLYACQTELNKVDNETTQLKTMNQELQNQLCGLHSSMAACRQRCVSTSEELNKCLDELQSQQAQKQNLESTTQQYKQQLNSVQLAHQELSRSYGQVVQMLENAKCKCGGVKSQETVSPKSYGSSTASCNSTTGGSDADEVYIYEETEEDFVDDEQSPRRFLKRVETITEQLQKSNQHWQKQMEDNDYAVTRDQ